MSPPSNSAHSSGDEVLENIDPKFHVSDDLIRKRRKRSFKFRNFFKTARDKNHHQRYHYRSKKKSRMSLITGIVSTSFTTPMPDSTEVERRFEDVLKKMDLPPNKAKLLRSYNLDKKWELVCDQEKVTDQGAPSMYIEKLRLYLNPKGTKKKKKILGDDTSTKLLKHLEISLRTNSIDWVREFLSDENNGLEILVQYLKHIQDAGGLQLPAHLIAAANGQNGGGGDHHNHMTPRQSHTSHHSHHENSSGSSSTFSTMKKAKLTACKSSNLGVPEDDVHNCIQCLRAIMNNTYGFNMVFNDNEAIYCLVCSILHPSLRTKSSVLILLAAICLVKGGHDLIINAFNRFRIEYSEANRFQTLFKFFRDPDEFHVDFMVACMQFINIVVHSVEDKNYRIFLQHEFKLLGLDDYIEKLKSNESEELQTQISAYLENMYDVGQLLDDVDQKNYFQNMFEDTQMKLSRAEEKLKEVETNYLMTSVRLENRMAELTREREALYKTDNDLNTLRRVMSQKEKEAQEKQARLETKIQELEELQKSIRAGLTSMGTPTSDTSSMSPHPPAPTPSSSSSAPLPPPPPPLPNVLPPPPPPNYLFSAPGSSGKPILPPPALPSAGQEAVSIKRRIQTKHKLPQLNWTALKPNQLKGTVFSELDDDPIIDSINFDSFEEMFKIGVNPFTMGGGGGPAGGTTAAESTNGGTHHVTNGVQSQQTLQLASSKKQTLLDHKRLRNLAITRRKLAIEPSEVARSVNNFDLQTLDIENVEILLRVLPTPEEIKAYKDFEASQKPVDSLSEEDKFLIRLSKIERLSQKLQIMSFMGNFRENVDLLSPSLMTIIAASKSVKDATNFHKILEIVLAYGNYMNSGKRGGVYGFKLQSLDILPFLKAPGSKNYTLLHAIAATVRERYPTLLNFTHDLKFVEKASGISLDAVVVDFNELEKLMELTKKEYALRAGSEVPQVLTQFLQEVDTKLAEFKTNTKIAQEAFRSCVEYYGETAKSTTTSAFFTVLMNFSKHFQQADEENLARKKAEALQNSLTKPVGGSSNASSPKRSDAEELRYKQAAIIGELERKGRRSSQQQQRGGDPNNRKRDLNEMGLGTFDDIISDMTRKPYIDVGAGKRQRSSSKDLRSGVELSRSRLNPVETEM